MQRLMLGVALATQLVSGLSAVEAAIDAAHVEHATGLPAQTSGDVVKVTLPRGDVTITVDGRPMAPFQGLTSWAAFQDHGADETHEVGERLVVGSWPVPAQGTTAPPTA